MKIRELYEGWRTFVIEQEILMMRTINSYDNEYRKYLEIQKDFIEREVAELTANDIIKCLRGVVLPKGKITRARFRTVKIILRHILQYAIVELGVDVAALVVVITSINFPDIYFKKICKDKESQIYKKSEMQRITNDIKRRNKRNELGLLLALNTGLRIGELCVLRKRNVKRDYIEVVISEHKAIYDGKTRYFIDKPKKQKERIVWLSEEAKNILSEILSQEIVQSEWLFPSSRDYREWTKTYCFDRMLRRVCRRNGIVEKSTHKMRRAYLSSLFEQGIPEKLIQEQAGHEKIQTTKNYYYYNTEDEEREKEIFKGVKMG